MDYPVEKLSADGYRPCQRWVLAQCSISIRPAGSPGLSTSD